MNMKLTKSFQKLKNITKKNVDYSFDFEVEESHRIIARHSNGDKNAFYTSNCNHPDIMDFITIKNDRTKVTGANISVRITDKFMNAVKNNDDFELFFPIDWKERGLDKPSMTKTVKAKEIWDLLVKNAHEHAEPGILFWDTIIENSPADCYADEGFETVSTNPCVIGDTIVLTNYGGIKIKNLENIKIDKPDLKIFTSDENHNYILSELEWVGITKKMDDILEVVFDNGEKLRCNKTHKLYRKNNFEQVEIQNVNIQEDEFFAFNSFCKIVSINDLNHKEDVYDLTANPNYNFFSVYGKDEFISNQPVDDINLILKSIKNLPILNVDCGEIPLSPMDSCRLLLLNLSKYVINPYTPDAFFDEALFTSHVYFAQRFMDDLVDLEEEKIDKIINKIENEDPESNRIKANEIEIWKKIKNSLLLGRRTGLGLNAVGDALAMLGLTYGSEESIQKIDFIFKCFRDAAYTSSIMMAIDLGTFPIYDPEKEKDNAFMNRLFDENSVIKDLHSKFGRRNISLLTMAPSGTISCITQTTSGIEPVFRTSYIRRKKITNDTEKADFIDQNGIKFKEFKVYHHPLKKYLEEDSSRTEETSPWFNSTSDKINWKNSVILQAVAQKYLCHSISKSVNVPNEATVEDISTIFLTAWEQGCKGITVYRDGSRTGVLITEPSSTGSVCGFKHKNDGVKRPKQTKGEVHHVKMKGKDYYVTVGFLENQPYEIFVGENHRDLDTELIRYNIPKEVKSGIVTKLKRGVYELTDNETNIKYILSGYIENSEIEAITRMISMSLRHKIDISFIVQQLEKISGFENFPKVLARTLKKYIPKGTKVSGEQCPTCSSENLAREDGCVRCLECGWTKCS